MSDVVEPVRIEVFAKLQAMMHHPAWRDLLAKLGPADTPKLVEEFLADQPPAFCEMLDRAAFDLDVSGPDPSRRILAHQFSSFMREARALSRRELHRRIRFEGIDAVTSLGRVPLVVLCPMTLMTADAMAVIDATTRMYLTGRQVITYGEEMDTFLEQFPEYERYFASNRANPLREIIATLQSGGTFFTYCDFNYNTHKSVDAAFANQMRRFSRSFIRMIQSVRPILVPTVMQIDGDEIIVQVLEPIEDIAKSDAPQETEAIVALVASVTEKLVRKAGAQWLLLPTLCFDNPEMG